MSEFAITISCDLDNTGNITTFVLDTVYDTNINSSSSITSHPVVSGDIIADHMWNNPDTLSLRGTFSLNGSKGIVVDGEGTRLQNVQSLFEKIKRNGILCSIVKIRIKDKDQLPRFNTRHNMVLTNISWVEKINSLDFTFSFSQALLADTQEYVPTQDDSFSPDLDFPKSSNFTDTLMNVEQVDAIIIEVMKNNNVVTEEFLNFLRSMSQTALIAVGVGVAAAAVLVGVLSIPVAGWIVAAVGAAIVMVAGLIKWIKGAVERSKLRIKQFDYHRDEKKNRSELNRFAGVIEEIHNELVKLNDYMTVYAVSENAAQISILNIDNNYYQFKFEKNNTSNSYGLTVLDINDSIEKTIPNISSCIEDISQATNDNCLLNLDTGSYVYLICNDEDKTKLTNYYILVTTLNMNEYANTLKEIIKNVLVY